MTDGTNPNDYERMKGAIRAGERAGFSPLQSVALMNPPLRNPGALIRRWLDERREQEGADA